jgi:hypothetical protein
MSGAPGLDSETGTMSPDILRLATREIVDRLAEKDYESAIRLCAKSRLTNDDLRTVIRDYGRTVVLQQARHSGGERRSRANMVRTRLPMDGRGRAFRSDA